MRRNPTKTDPCVSPATLATAPTYTDRPLLWNEFLWKMQKPCRGRRLAHGIAVVGLGGTGKTQLVLRFVEERRYLYDTILWIDVQNEATARSSFERCCSALQYDIGMQTTSRIFHDSLPVQKLMEFLASRTEKQPWLVIFDNADQLADTSDSFSIGHLIPEGRAGSVIVISQDANAAACLLGRAESVKVDVMHHGEAFALLRQCMDVEAEDEDPKVTSLLGEVVTCLDMLPLAIDLAGTRIKNDMEDADRFEANGSYSSAILAMEGYLVDFRKHQRTLLSAKQYQTTSQYKKTVWTAWETTLSSLAQQSELDCKICPAQLLRLMTFLDRANVQRELFRSASQSLRQVSEGLKIAPPEWFLHLLDSSGSGKWDSFTYRESIRILKRFGLIHVTDARPIDGDWSGTTMHSLVRWRATAEAADPEYWICYIVLIHASCETHTQNQDTHDFRKQLRYHLPASSNAEKLLSPTSMDTFKEKHIVNICTSIGTTWMALRHYPPAAHWLHKAWNFTFGTFGPQDSGSRQLMIELFVLQRRLVGLQRRDGASPEDQETMHSVNQLISTIAQPLSEIPNAELHLRICATALDCDGSRICTPDVRKDVQNMRSHMICMEMLEIEPGDSKLSDEEGRRRRLQSMRSKPTWIELWHGHHMRQQDEAADMKADLLKRLEKCVELFGDLDRLTFRLKSQLAHFHGYLMQPEEEKSLVSELLAYEQQTLGTEHPKTLQTMERLAQVERAGRDHRLALQRMTDCAWKSADVLGKDNPNTLERANQAAEWSAWREQIDETPGVGDEDSDQKWLERAERREQRHTELMKEHCQVS